MFRILARAAVVALGACACLPSVASAAAPTVVSLTFDDGRVSQSRVAAPILASHHLTGTFYVNVGHLGRYGDMTWDQVEALAAAGNEIGGHSVYHRDLVAIPLDEARREICDERSELLDHGLSPVSFAYPYGSHDADVEQVVQGCGYSSARAAGGLDPKPRCAAKLACAETFPPLDQYAIRTPPAVGPQSTLADLEGYVQHTEASGGGLVPLQFHDVDSSGAPYSIDPTTFSQLLDWLVAEQDAGTIEVETMGDALGSTPLPAGAVAPLVAQTRPQLAVDGSLEKPTADQTDGEIASCWTHDGGGNGSVTWSMTADPVRGSQAAQVQIDSLAPGGWRALELTQDLGACSPSTAPGETLHASFWYRSTMPVQLEAWQRVAGLLWVPQTTGPPLPPASTWAHAGLKLTMPADGSADALSFGAVVNEPGTAAFDGFSLVATS